jgi:AraC-like DNA-binding protein
MSETKVTRTFAEVFGENLLRFATQLTKEELQRNAEQRADREQIEAADNEAQVRELMAKLGYIPENGGVL